MSKISLEKLERRLSALEETVARLVETKPKPGRFKNWRRAAGMFAGHKLMKEIDEAGRRIREADRQNGRP